MKDLVAICAKTLRVNLGLHRQELLLIVYDAPMRPIAEAFLQAGRELTEQVESLEIESPKVNGQEPPPTVGERMAAVQVVLLPLTRSLSWTKARMEATNQGARIASMPGITPDIMRRTLSADYPAIRERVNQLANLLDQAESVRVTTELGTDLTFSVQARKAHGRKGGIFRQPGEWGNLPCGEAFLAPVEGTGHGSYVVDASHAGIGRLRRPIRIRVEAGLAVDFQGGPQADQLRQLLSETGDARAFTVAEFGIGCNDQARVTGITLEDEKALGTCHFALGRNAPFGGQTDVGIHLDGVLRSPTIELDGTRLMEAGRLAGKVF